MSATMNQAEFGRHMGVERSYITELKQKGRLVLDEQGKIMVAESEALIKQTEDPAKKAVADRHAQAREQQTAPEMDDMSVKVGSAYQQARAMKEKYAAMQAKVAYEKDTGQLLETSHARMAVLDSDAIVRNRLESLPDILSPQLAVETDEHKIRALLIDQVEIVLTDLSVTFKKMIQE